MNVAEIWLWHVNTWRVAGRLQSHTLTVTQLEFSHDNRFLLSVSRDRHFSVFYLDKTGNSYCLFYVVVPTYNTCIYTQCTYILRIGILQRWSWLWFWLLLSTPINHDYNFSLTLALCRSLWL